jgi:putative oxidoreductase
MRKLFSTRVSDNAFGFGMLVLRLGFGGLMLINHGWGKLSNYSQYASQFGDPIGVGPSASLALTVFAEFFCAAFIVVGLFTRLAAIPLIITMGVAFFIAHKGVYAPGPGSGEMALLFLIAYLTLLFTGPGKFSVDRLISK